MKLKSEDRARRMSHVVSKDRGQNTKKMRQSKWGGQKPAAAEDEEDPPCVRIDIVFGVVLFGLIQLCVVRFSSVLILPRLFPKGNWL